ESGARSVAVYSTREDAAGADSLFRVEWSDLPPSSVAAADRPVWVAVSDAAGITALADGAGPEAALPAVAVLDAVADGADGVDAALVLTNRVLAAVQAWLAAPGLEEARLVVATRGAVGAGADGAVTDPAGGAVWGLIRAAQTENPDRIVLLDLDPAAPDDLDTALAAALPLGESQVAVRGTALHVPRLARTAGEVPGGEPAFRPDGTVLITGGTGSLGALTARHLVARHGVRHLVLAGRRGPDAGGAAELAAELEAAGATVSVVACDVTDREAVAALLAAVPAGHPLTGIVHAARVFDAGVIGEVDPDRMARVFAPKVTAVRHLDELSRELAPELDAFVLMSSASSVFLGAGTGGYAAANAYLDAVAHRRRAAGLPGTSLAWGVWAQADGSADGPGQDRSGRRGVRPLTAEAGTALFDAALRTGEALLVPGGRGRRA
ncbi:beta-ketoacyl reductase, partial [Kitasatospora sp. NPDC058263]